MYSIGDLARLGGVSVRMLRHYDEIALLRPARVDERTAYRFYEPAQLGRLHRIVALRDLGFSLPQIGQLLEEDLSPDQLRGMLRMRRAQLQDEIAEHHTRLERINTLIAHLDRSESRKPPTQQDPKQPDTEQEHPMTGSLPTTAVRRATIEAMTVVECTAVAADFGPDNIGPVLQPLYPTLFQTFGAAGVAPVGPTIAYYTERADGAIDVHAAAPIDPATARVFASMPGVQIAELPAIDAVSAIHRGPMATIGETYESLISWIADHGLVTVGFSREVYLDCPENEADWVTELQFAVQPA